MYGNGQKPWHFLFILKHQAFYALSYCSRFHLDAGTAYRNIISPDTSIKQEYINRKNTAQLRQEINALQMEIDTARKRRSELATLFKRLYEDNVLGRVTNEQFRLLSADYNAEQKEIDDALPLKEERLEKLKSSAANVDAFIEKAKRYKTIDKLTPEIVRLFIARIEVGERTVKYSRHSAQKIRIIYRDIGEWDYDDAVEAEQQQPQVVAVTVAQPELLPA